MVVDGGVTHDEAVTYSVSLARGRVSWHSGGVHGAEVAISVLVGIES